LQAISRGCEPDPKPFTGNRPQQINSRMHNEAAYGLCATNSYITG